MTQTTNPDATDPDTTNPDTTGSDPGPSTGSGTISGPTGEASQRDPMRVDPKLLEMLVCPLTRGRLDYDPVAQELVSRGARLAFPIRDGIPIMLPDEARPLTD